MGFGSGIGLAPAPWLQVASIYLSSINLELESQPAGRREARAARARVDLRRREQTAEGGEGDSPEPTRMATLPSPMAARAPPGCSSASICGGGGGGGGRGDEAGEREDRLNLSIDRVYFPTTTTFLE